MSKQISRRRALAAGALASGAFAAAAAGAPAKKSTVIASVENPPFLTPWSPPPGAAKPPAITPGKTPIRLAAWSSATTLDYRKDMSISDMVKRIRDAGYTAANSSCGQNQRNPWLEASEDEIRELKEALNKYDVLYFDVHTYTNNIHPDIETRKKNHRYVIEQCEAAERVGCTMITTHTGTRSAEQPISPHPENWTSETWKLSVATIKQLLKDTAGMNVRFAIEAVNMTASNNPRAHRCLLDEVGDKRLKICLDPVNMMHMGLYYRTTELIAECFDRLGDDIIAAHAKDTYVLPDKMSMYVTEVAPGKGILDYKTYLAGLSTLSVPCPLIIEHIPDDQYAGAKKYIEDMAASVGVKFYG